MKAKNFRKRSIEAEDEDEVHERRSALALEEVKFLQRQREKKLGIPALLTSASSASAGGGVTYGSTGGLARNVNDKSEGDIEKDDLVLQDTFAQETAVMVEDPNMYKLKNIEETEAAKRLLQEKRLVGLAKAESSIPSSFSADFFQHGKDYTEKLRKGGFVFPMNASMSALMQMFCSLYLSLDHPQLYKDKGADNNGLESKHADSLPDAASRRQAATDAFMLERFRKRERQRLVRR
ncbi:protein COP1 SUPPRESSOR 2 [Sesamum angolense]|uniref:Protein COP1 SUPPRESSOR 2 n=1 Tax=Sesamum angolense TaxID=2727404 RepID=A0AAE1X873_9LAMI|nr:protein COP1 SUPPRESSOR 2 [Sesamum angolense]